VSDFLARATARQAVQPPDGKSRSTFEQVVVDGQRYFVKRVTPSADWFMRVTGDQVHRSYVVWRAGIMDEATDVVDHAVVAMERSDDGRELTIVMRDVGTHLVPEGDDVVPLPQHARFVEDLAALSVRFWTWSDDGGQLTTMTQRLRFFDDVNVTREMAVADPPGPIAAAAAGWPLLAERTPWLADVAAAVQADPAVLTEPMAATPSTFLHGDWKMGNLGSRPDGRTILLDWACPGAGPACWDLCWYLALNRARLPEPKEATVQRFAAALADRGVDPTGWFERQLDLCTVGMMATFGWEKALGDDAELHWWERRVAQAVRRQGLDLPSPPD
jgi:hypothetical protein